MRFSFIKFWKICGTVYDLNRYRLNHKKQIFVSLNILRIAYVCFWHLAFFDIWTQSCWTSHRLVWPVSQIMWPVPEHSIICDRSQIAKMLTFSGKISSCGADFSGKKLYQHILRLVTRQHRNEHVQHPTENKIY